MVKIGPAVAGSTGLVPPPLQSIWTCGCAAIHKKLGVAVRTTAVLAFSSCSFFLASGLLFFNGLVLPNEKAFNLLWDRDCRKGRTLHAHMYITRVFPLKYPQLSAEEKITASADLDRVGFECV